MTSHNMMSIGPRQSKNKQLEKEPNAESVSLGVSLGVSVQLAPLLARWQVQYQALGRVRPENCKICQLDLEKEKQRKKKKSQIYHVHLLGRWTAVEGFLKVLCKYDPGLELNDNSSEYRSYQEDI